MHLTEYETTVVIRPDIGGDAVEGTLDRFRDVVRNSGGKLLAINHWGKKKLAYEIEKHTRGIYVHAHYLGANTLVAELERNMRISDNVLRFLTVRLAENIAADEREEKAYVRPQYEADDQNNDDDVEFGSDDEYDRRDRDRDRDRNRDSDSDDDSGDERDDDNDGSDEEEK